MVSLKPDCVGVIVCIATCTDMYSHSKQHFLNPLKFIWQTAIVNNKGGKQVDNTYIEKQCVIGKRAQCLQETLEFKSPNGHQVVR